MGAFFTKSTKVLVHVYTGDRRYAGTDANVRITIYDEFGNESNPIYLDNFFRNDFERGQMDTFHIPDSDVANLDRSGKITRIQIWRDSSGLGDNWFVDKIDVENRLTNVTYVFPIFRWIKADYYYNVDQYDTSLPQNDMNKEQRSSEMAEKRTSYEFDQKLEGGPAQVKEMPNDEKFSFEYKWDIIKLKAKLVGYSYLVRIMQSGEFESLDDLKEVYKDNFHKPKGIERWNNDLYFGLQRVASLNNTVIQLLTEIPTKFPVTDELLKMFLEGRTLSEALSQKRLFVCDLKMLEGIPVNEQHVLCVPIALFYLNNDNELKPIAIQLFQEPGPENPIFTPSDPGLTWALVKMWYNNADAAYHQALTHLGLTHLLMEGVTVATHRNLSQSHPIFKLLAPHFLYLIAINSRGLDVLVADGGWVDKTMNYGNKGLFALIIKGLNNWRMDVEGTLPEDLKNRGLDDPNVLPCYHFRDDAMLLYEAIKSYVKSYVDLYYTSSSLLEGDTEIQGWVQELVKERNKSEGGVGIKGVPGNGQLNNTEDLIVILTSIIFTCSISHASTNFPQYEEYGFPPNYPGLMRTKPPSSKDADIKDKDIIAALPDKPTTLDIMTVTKILSAKGTKSIGDFEVQYIFDPPAREIVDKFRRDLKQISQTVKERNRHRNPPYEYLDPDIVPNSISI